MTYQITPSILAADFTRLGEEVTAVLDAGADMIHFDVMDNHYVPNLSVGPLVLESMRKSGFDCKVDVHLMVKPVDRLVEDFMRHKPHIITVHPETTEHLHRTLSTIRQGNVKPGVVFNPATPIDLLDEVIDMVDLVLIMSVNPGFGGQKFIEDSKRKLTAAREKIQRSGRQIMLQVDGGISVSNIAEVAVAGADTFVAGSAIFGSDDYTATIAAMRKALSTV